MDDSRKGNGWVAWCNQVLKDQDKQEDCIQDQQKMITALQVEVAVIKVKVSIYGFAAGIIAGVLASIIYNAIAK